MRAAKAQTALAKQYRYSLTDSSGNDLGKVILSEAEFITYALQTGRKPETYVERPCAKCQEYRCVGHELCPKGKTVCSMTNGQYGTVITKTGYDFAKHLINVGLITFEAVQKQINFENSENEKAMQEAERIKEEKIKATEIEARAETDFNDWISKATANYGVASVSENEKLLIQKDIFMHLVGGFNTRVIKLLVLIDNIENPRCRRDIISLLHNDNNASIVTFEHITGIKLAKSYKERKTQLQTITNADYGEMKQYKPRKAAVQSEYNDIFYVLNRVEGSLEFVESRGRLWRYGGFDFYIQKHGQGLYKVTEGRSGLMVINNCKTLGDLKKSVASKVAGNAFSTSIKRNIENCGLSPLYSKNNE